MTESYILEKERKELGKKSTTDRNTITLEKEFITESLQVFKIYNKSKISYNIRERVLNAY